MEYLAHVIIHGMYVTSWGYDCFDAYNRLAKAFGINTAVEILACSITLNI